MEKEEVIVRTSKNRELTEFALLNAVNTLIEDEGFENLGVNAVAAKAGVSKMLIYRYFDSLDGLIAAYNMTTGSTWSRNCRIRNTWEIL